MQFLQITCKNHSNMCAFKRKQNSMYGSKATNEMYSQVAKSPKIWKLEVPMFLSFFVFLYIHVNSIFKKI
jgi:hypothetical protein